MEAAPPAIADEPFASLNPAQRRAVMHGRVGGATGGATGGVTGCATGVQAGPLLVIAGAGTGKTATLAHRVAWLVVNGVPPSRILLLTFSRRAAQEMLRRAERIVAQALPGARARLEWAGTFHAVGARLLREHAHRVGLDPAFGILDRGDAADMIDWIRQEQGHSGRGQRFPRKDTCLAIYSQRVNSGEPLEQVLEQRFPWCAQWQAELGALFSAYVERKLAEQVLDFDDLLLWWQAAMEDAQFAQDVSSAFDHVLVDEYQDTNTLQARILRSLRPAGAGLTVVGDDAQSIYSFRAANVGNILDFPKQFEPEAERVVLELNYRSVQGVLDSANALMLGADGQFRKNLRSTRAAGARPRLVTVLDDAEQVRFVVETVLLQRESGIALRDQAVLFRTGHHSDSLEVELVRRNIPFVKYGGLKFLESTHVKDVLSVLRWISNARNGTAAFRCLQLIPGIGPAHSRRILDALAAAGFDWSLLREVPVPEAAGETWTGLCDLIADLHRAESRWDGQLDRVLLWYRPLLADRYDDAQVRDADLQMLATVSVQFASRDQFLTELTLDPPSASGDLAGPPLRDEDYLILSTVHSAKGQEWKSVHLLNVADGNFPNEFQVASAAGLAEERRLLYVAMTRARDHLYLVEPLRYHVTQQPRLGQRHVHAARSRFLTRAVLQTLERRSADCNADASSADRAQGQAATPSQGRVKVDVAGRLRGLW